MAPRAGLAGLADRYLGPGASQLDVLRVLCAGAGGLLLGLLTVPIPWPERLLLGLLSAELCAGLMAALNHAGKHWIHRRHQRWPRLLGFLTLQTLILTGYVWLLRDFDLPLLGNALLLLWAGSAAVLLAPARWQRAIGLTLLLAMLFTLQSWHGQPQTAAWFLPLFYARTLLARLPSPQPEA